MSADSDPPDRALLDILENLRQVLQPTLSTTSTATIQQLDDLLTSIQVTTRQALNQRRSLDRNLSAEVLVITFKYLLEAVSRSAAPEGAVWDSSFRTSSAILALSQVSRGWRSLILELPSLWCVVTDRRPEGFHAFVERSRNRPIAVHLGCSASGRDDLGVVQRLPELGPRIRELYWTTRDSAVPKVDLLAFPAPMLEVLHVKYDFGADDDDDDDEDRNTGAPPALLFADYAPRLRALHMANIGWLPDNRFASLTHLCLEMVWTPLRFSDILSLVWHCPRLEHLALIEVVISPTNFPAPVPPPPDLSKPAWFPSIRRLTLDYMTAEVAADFLHYFAPHSADTAMQILRTPLNRNTYYMPFPMTALMLPMIWAPVGQLAWMRPRGHSGPVTLVAAGQRTAVRLSSAPENDESGADWSEEWPHRWGLEQLGVLLNLPVEVFYFSFLAFPARLPHPAADILSRIRWRAPTLRQLVLWTNDLSGLLNALYNTNLVGWRAGETQWRVPRLDIVVVPRWGPTLAVDEDTEPFDGAFGIFPGGELLFDKVVIHSPLDSREFEGPLSALQGLCPDVTYRQGSTGPTMQLPDVCRDPFAHPGWNGASWKLEPC